ncbi:MAG: alkaline phosphatase family protein [Bacteroidota bacterium]
MKRSEFIKRLGIAASGAAVAPSILPSGYLFAATGGPSVPHVVICLLAGGVRNRESVEQAEGNLMPHLFAEIGSAVRQIAPPPLQHQGTLYQNFRYARGPVLHAAAQVAVLSGHYPSAPRSTTTAVTPTAFALLHRHRPAASAWWLPGAPVSGAARGSSGHPHYGVRFRVDVPPVAFSPATGTVPTPDEQNLARAKAIIRQQRPNLLVVHLQDMDAAHFSYARYRTALQIADRGVAQLWRTIQATPGMTDNTVLFVLPDHGRDRQPNAIPDASGRFGLDHTDGDTEEGTSRDIFCLVLGPERIVVQDQVIAETRGESIDLLPTLVQLWGIERALPRDLHFPGRSLQEALVARQ